MATWATPTNETLYGQERQHAIDNAGIVNRTAFEVNIGLFTGLALVTVLIRFYIRGRHIRKMLLDDYLLVLGAACLVVSMSMLYWYSPQLFVVEALNTIPNKVIVTMDEVMPLLDGNKKIQTFLGTNWTAIYAVKFSFLAYFWALVRNISPRLKPYFWSVVVFTTLSWAFVVSEGFILCPWFGVDAVVTVPMIIIHRAKMSTMQKVALGTFLSLSLMMVIMAVVRIVGSVRGSDAALDVAWEMFWQQLEGCVAVMMGSLTAFRGVFNRGDEKGSGESTGDLETASTGSPVQQQSLMPKSDSQQSGAR
ncbi:integral membrane [Neofusicoccum parvum]|uniref:Integral membrane n=1 Tax=Neofusicoccum parvum TaxID=310453 RepID=A0ACB5SH11_9PEZI|nr:integral membrane [Neofusicoccum parvum]